jgi:alanine racemase
LTVENFSSWLARLRLARRLAAQPFPRFTTIISPIPGSRSICKIWRGDSVSYHRAFVAQRETQVATLPIGYSDGYPAQAAGKAEILVQGRRWPTIALVTSNHATINVTGAKEIKIGDEAVIFGKQGENEISAEELAAWAGISVYKILIGMNPLLQRVYVGT